MDHIRLRDDLRKLQGELRATQSTDPREQRMLRQLETDIEELLSRKDDNLRPDPDARERFSEALAQVEASHPRVTLLMRQVVDSLSYLGI